MVFKPSNILLLPGWQNSGPGHWQSLWQARHGYRRVEQHDWLRPLRGDWTARLEETVVDADGPALLVAHSLGCLLAAWGAAMGGPRIWPHRSTTGAPLPVRPCHFPPCWWPAAMTPIAVGRVPKAW